MGKGKPRALIITEPWRGLVLCCPVRWWENVPYLGPLVRWQFKWWLSCGGDSPGQYSAMSDLPKSGCKAAEWSPTRLREEPVKVRCQTPCKASAFPSSQQLCKPDPWIIWPWSACSDMLRLVDISVRLLVSWMTCTRAAQIILQNLISLPHCAPSISSELVPCAKFTLLFTKHKLSCGVLGYSSTSLATRVVWASPLLDIMPSKHPNIAFQK